MPRVLILDHGVLNFSKFITIAILLRLFMLENSLENLSVFKKCCLEIPHSKIVFFDRILFFEKFENGIMEM